MKAFFFLVFVVFLAVLSRSYAAPVSASPENEEECPKDDSKSVTFFDQKGCNKYFQCVNGTKVEMTCPEGQEYNAFLGVCDDPKYAHCKLKPETNNTESSSPTTSSSSEASTEPPKDNSTTNTSKVTEDGSKSTEANTPKVPDGSTSTEANNQSSTESSSSSFEDKKTTEAESLKSSVDSSSISSTSSSTKASKSSESDFLTTSSQKPKTTAPSIIHKEPSTTPSTKNVTGEINVKEPETEEKDETEEEESGEEEEEDEEPKADDKNSNKSKETAENSKEDLKAGVESEEQKRNKAVTPKGTTSGKFVTAKTTREPELGGEEEQKSKPALKPKFVKEVTTKGPIKEKP